MPVAAKAFFVVTAGIIPEVPLPEHSRQWSYTSVDQAADRAVPVDAETKFAELRAEALAHARDLMNPAAVNWVHMEFLWL
jgi:hypothetical protein